MSINFLLLCYAFIFGLALGSFINVCIYRIPLKKSIVRPASACPRCNTQIRFYDNIPLVSYLLLRGKCRYCSHPISWQYPLVELICGLLSLFLFIKYGPSYQYLLFLLFVLTLVTVSFIDFHHQIIPDLFTLPGIAAGIIASLILHHIPWLHALIGALAGGGFLFVVALVFEKLTGKEGMGMGDVKLLTMIGAWLGWVPLPLIVLISSLTGALLGVIFLLFSGKGLRARIPFGPYLSLGAIIYCFFGPQITNWYIRLFS